MKRVLKFALGLLASSIGLAIIIWCAYGFIAPSDNLHFGLKDMPQLGAPLALVAMGWLWMRGDVGSCGSYTCELSVVIKLTGIGFGTAEERRTILVLKHELERALEEKELGEIDGEEFGDGECCLFVHTKAPSKAAKLVREFLSSRIPPVSVTISTSEL